MLVVMLTVAGDPVAWVVDALPSESPADPNMLLPELDEKIMIGAARLVGDAGETPSFEKLDVVVAGITTGMELLAAGCGAIAEQGGPLAQPVMTSRPLVNLRL